MRVRVHKALQLKLKSMRVRDEDSMNVTLMHIQVGSQLQLLTHSVPQVNQEYKKIPVAVRIFASKRRNSSDFALTKEGSGVARR